jgi:hypothetical protein
MIETQMEEHVVKVMDALSGVRQKEGAAREVTRLVRETDSKPKLHMTPRIRLEAEKMISAKDFSRAEAVHFIALHDALHEKVYGLPDPDVNGKSFRIARSNCQSWIEALGKEQLLDYIRWAWREEFRREVWRRENHRDGGRLSISTLLSRHKLTEYRISLARQKGQ